MTNPVEVNSHGLVTPPGSSIAEQVQDRSNALVVKAFNLAQASVWSCRRVIEGEPLVVPVASDFDAARDVATELAVAAGFSALDIGELRHARHLEAMAAVVIRRLFLGDPATATFAWVR